MGQDGHLPAISTHIHPGYGPGWLPCSWLRHGASPTLTTYCSGGVAVVGLESRHNGLAQPNSAPIPYGLALVRCLSPLRCPEMTRGYITRCSGGVAMVGLESRQYGRAQPNPALIPCSLVLVRFLSSPRLPDMARGSVTHCSGGVAAIAMG